MRLKLILAAATALIAVPAMADTTVIHAGTLITDAASTSAGPATITVTDGRIVKVEAGHQPFE
ncbi:MAG: amidohydrolase family protein, partial [Novosphingobium sp.]